MEYPPPSARLGPAAVPCTLLPLPLWWDGTPHASSPSKCSTLCSSSADCDSYCKPAKGNYKINMKKYCKKDYGKDLLLPWAMLGFAAEAAEGQPKDGSGWGDADVPGDGEHPAWFPKSALPKMRWVRQVGLLGTGSSRHQSFLWGARQSIPHDHASPSFPSVVQVNILEMETVANWAKFTINILSVYKCRDERVKRGDNFLWIHLKDLSCKCPKIQISKKYLVMGISENSTDRPGLMADKNSLVIQWRDAWTRRLRKLQRREKKGKCVKP